MSFSHNSRSRFDLRSIGQGGHRLAQGSLRPGTTSLFRAVSCRLALAVVLACALAPAMESRAGDQETTPPAAPAATDTGAPANPSEPAISEETPSSSTPGAFTRPRRRTPRAAAEIPTEVRAASPGARMLLTPPRDLGNLNAWIDYRARAHVLALPVEARLFYRRGVLAHDAGRKDEGERWVRAAAEMDPSFIEPHLRIAEWSLPGRPSQALVHWAAVIDLARDSFVLQAGIAANVLFLTFQSLLAALLIAGMIVVLLRANELSHPWRERLSEILRPATARAWALAFVAVPYFAGFGVVLPTVVFLGMLWPRLRVRERAAFLMLTLGVAAIPWAVVVLDRLATPLDSGRAPLYGVALLENEPWSSERQNRLATLAAREPENPYLHFALAWIARRGGDLATSEREYRRSLERWPDDDRVITNLANVLAMQGRQDEAIELYERAVTAQPKNPAPHFNESQIYTQRFEYDAATEALARASALDFDLVRDYQSQGTSDGVLALVDQWIAPRDFWHALSEDPGPKAAAPSLPPSWRGLLETSGWRFSLIVVLAGLLAIAAGLLGQRALPLRSCSNCGKVVCRRCAQRRKEVALCRSCAALETRAQNVDFARVLLRRNKRRAESLRFAIRTVLATIVPGFGLIAFRRAFTPLLLLTATVLLAGPWSDTSLPFELEPRVAVPSRMPPMPLRIGMGVVIYLVSIGGYFSCLARARSAEAEIDDRMPARASNGPQRMPARAA